MEKEGTKSGLFNPTYDYAQNFIRKFGFLLKFGFQIHLQFHQSSDKNCNYGLKEFYVTIDNTKENYHAEIFFPIDHIKNGDYDFWSYDFDGRKDNYPSKDCEYTYQESLLILWAIFG